MPEIKRKKLIHPMKTFERDRGELRLASVSIFTHTSTSIDQSEAEYSQEVKGVDTFAR